MPGAVEKFQMTGNLRPQPRSHVSARSLADFVEKKFYAKVASLRQSVEPPIPPRPPGPPGCLSGYALDEWHRLAPELHRLGLLSELDVMPLASYCTAYKTWRDACELLAREDQQMVADDKANVLIRIARNSAAQMTTIGAQFGLTPHARLRLAGTTPPQQPGKFAGLVFPYDDD